jgi:Carboxypeptidase regulatory-like domain
MNLHVSFRVRIRSLMSAIFILCCAAGLSLAQDLATKGGISGRVTDSTGAVIPNAKITINGPTGERVVTANESGEFDLENLIPGSYKVKAEQTGFKSVSVPEVVVNVGKSTALKLTLETGNISEVVEVTAGAVAVDTASTAAGANLNDQLFQNLPLQRGVTSLFYLTAGVTDSLGGGTANPSISGGSALDNLYVADGVNITDASFGGLGVFSRVYGTLGVGINTSYIKEVQVKTGGFEPQYGQSQGGIVNIITKSGTNEYHGSVYGFFRPNAFEAERLQRDDVRTNKIGKILAEENYDYGADFGGPVPGLKDKLFFFGSFNPTFRREIVRGAEGSGLRQIYGDQTHRRFFTKNYALKVDYNMTPSHQVNFSIFGDPTTTNKAPHNTLNIDNTTANSVLDFGTRNLAVRYNGTLTSTWTVSAAFSQGRNRFDETGFDSIAQIIDQTRLAAGQRGEFVAVGLGFYEPTDSTTYRGTADTQKQVSFLGNHTIGLGYQFQRAFYSGLRERSGPRFTVPFANADGIPLTQLYGAAASAVGEPVNAQFRLRTASNTSPTVCPLCPLMVVPETTTDIGLGVGVRRVFLQQFRGEYGTPGFETESKYHAAYAQDTWKLNRFITALIGYRWEQERLVGSPGITGERLNYVFSGNWSPRLGVTVDPFGKGKTKAYYNFGRFHEFIPLDLAERSLSAEASFIGGRYAPEFTVVNGARRVVINQYGTVNPVVSSNNLLNGAANGFQTVGITISLQDPHNPILPGTKLGYADEHLIGFEQQLPWNMVLSVRYIDRKLKRIVEDAAVVSPEAAAFFGQAYFIGNITAKLDAAVNPIGFKFNPVFNAAGDVINVPSQCDPHLVNPEVTDNTGKLLGGICYAALGKNGQPAGDSGADGVPDGFPDPVHKYRGVEIELNKRFSNNWQLLANWRIAKLEGNFEGHFRNDNGQTDPAISSLFDFTAGEFNLLGDQFAVGPLNTDRRHVANIYASYAFGERGLGARIRGLNLGGGLHMESGVPISEFLAHPAYLNAGEIPVGGRGKLGRTDFYTRIDLHADYPFKISERVSLKFVADFFNITNNRDVRLPDQNRERTGPVDNVDFGTPLFYRLPFNMRLGLRLDF